MTEFTEGDFWQMCGFCGRLWRDRKDEKGHTWVSTASFADIGIPRKPLLDAWRDGTLKGYAKKWGYDVGGKKLECPQHGTTKGTTLMWHFDIVKKP